MKSAEPTLLERLRPRFQESIDRPESRDRQELVIDILTKNHYFTNLTFSEVVILAEYFGIPHDFISFQNMFAPLHEFLREAQS